MAVKFTLKKPVEVTPKKEVQKPVAKKAKPGSSGGKLKLVKKPLVEIENESQEDASMQYFKHDLVDKIGDMQEQLKKAQKVIADYNALCNKLHAYGDDLSSSEYGIMIQGEKYNAELGPRGNKTTILKSNVEIANILTPEVYIKLASVTISDLNKYLVPEQLEGILKTERTGNRKLTITEK